MENLCELREREREQTQNQMTAYSLIVLLGKAAAEWEGGGWVGAAVGRAGWIGALIIEKYSTAFYSVAVM